MVYLKEPFGEAEKDLHEARLALKKVNEGGSIKALYEAMSKLESKERKYFARRFGANNAVLKGWKEGLTLFHIKHMVFEIEEHRDDAGNYKDGLTTTTGYLKEALECANHSVRIGTKVIAMVDRWNKPVRDRDRLFKSDQYNIQLTLDEMYKIKDEVENSSASADIGGKTLPHIDWSIQMAEKCKHVATLIRLGEWDKILEYIA